MRPGRQRRLRHAIILPLERPDAVNDESGRERRQARSKIRLPDVERLAPDAVPARCATTARHHNVEPRIVLQRPHDACPEVPGSSQHHHTHRRVRFHATPPMPTARLTLPHGLNRDNSVHSGLCDG